MTNQGLRHVPVLLKDAIEFLHVRPGATVADCTLGMAGHAAEIVRKVGSQGHLIGFDRDPEALALAKEQLENVANELGSQAPKITLIGEAFSSIARRTRDTWKSRPTGRTVASTNCSSACVTLTRAASRSASRFRSWRNAPAKSPSRSCARLTSRSRVRLQRNSRGC